jgi:Undecaprenyl-phosphate galactose phosphotransferase WbaP
MAHVDTSVSQRTAAAVDFEDKRRTPAEYARSFRKPLVALFLISGDVAAALAAIAVSGALAAWAAAPLPTGSFVLIALLIPLFFALGLYTRSDRSPYERFRRRILGLGIFVALGLAAGLPAGRPGFLLLATACDAVCLALLGHYFEAFARGVLIRLDIWGARAAVVGCGEDSRSLAAFLKSRPSLGLSPVGLIGTLGDGETQRSHLPLPLMGSLTNPGRVPEEIEILIFTSAADLDAFLPQSHIVTPRLLLVDGVHSQNLALPVHTSCGGLGVEFRRNLYLRHNRLLKRLIDIALAVPLAMLAGPVIAVLALAIKLIDPGPAFYVQTRVGRNGATFGMIKLRTMYAHAERRLERHLAEDAQARAEWARYFKLRDDPRVLPKIGLFMRRSSLDELPQLWNVIRGDMSLVGPRPFPAYHIESFDAEFRTIRHSVLPGVTGAWQTSSRSDGDLQVQKAEDLFYIRNWSLLLDIYLLLQTLPAVLRAEGAR